VLDALGNIVATLYNNEFKTSYIIVDVSTYAWLNQTGDGHTSLVEVLYKTKFYKFFNDTDEFCADGYDDAIAYKALGLYFQGQEGKEQDAILYNALCKNVCDSNVSSAEKGQTLKIAHAPNPVYQIFRKLRSTWNYRNWRMH
jgi:hypothetical protein